MKITPREREEIDRVAEMFTPEQIYERARLGWIPEVVADNAIKKINKEKEKEREMA